MDVDLVYSYLIDTTWLFLGSWVVLLLTAGVIAFTDWSRPRVSVGTGSRPVNRGQW
jgi:hypothetical protein